MLDPLLRALAGVTCLVAIAIAALTARGPLAEPSRVRFISEILAACRRTERAWRGRWGFWGSLGTTLLLGLGAIVFAIDAVRRGGVDGGAGVATSLTLLGVAVIPLREVADPRSATGWDFAHPIAAAAFYLAATILSALTLGRTGPVGLALSIVHLASSGALIGVSIYTTGREFSDGFTLWPPLGTRILLDVRADSRARWVRWLQWPATVAVGLALGGAALGV